MAKKPRPDETPLTDPQADPTPDPVETPAEAAPPQPTGELALTARQFVRARGYRWERSAGFLLEQAQQLGREARLTSTEWLPRWEAFWQRPVK